MISMISGWCRLFKSPVGAAPGSDANLMLWDLGSGQCCRDLPMGTAVVCLAVDAQTDRLDRDNPKRIPAWVMIHEFHPESNISGHTVARQHHLHCQNRTFAPFACQNRKCKSEACDCMGRLKAPDESAGICLASRFRMCTT